MGSHHRSTDTWRYVQWGGLAAILASLLIVIGDYSADFANSRTEGAFSDFAAGTPFFVAVLVGIAGGLLAVLGVTALYVGQARQAGAFGLVGYLGGVISAVMLFAGLWTAGFVFPTLAVEDPALLDAINEGEVAGPFGASFLVSGMLQSLGLILFAIASFRARVYSRPAAVAIVLGAVLMIPQVPLANVVMVGGLAWMGFELFTGRLERPAAVPGEMAADRTAPEHVALR